jgi:signal transduction histidine kinase
VRTNLGIVLQQAIEETEAAHPTGTILVEARGNLQGSWDEGRIKQVLSNLIENAIYHGNAESAIAVHLRGDDDQVVLTVHNEGAPIPEHECERIFEPLITAPETSSPLTSKHLGCSASSGSIGLVRCASKPAPSLRAPVQYPQRSNPIADRAKRRLCENRASSRHPAAV